MDEKRKLKRKKVKAYKSHLKKLKKLHVRSEDDEPI